MAKILITGDPHLKIGSFEVCKQFLDWFRDLAFELKPDLIVNLGDTLDTHGVIRAEIMALMVDHIDQLTAKGFTYYQLLGNHEFNKPTDKTYHALKSLKGRKNHVIVDEQIDLEPAGITFLPYYANPKDFPKSTGRVVFCHQTFLGADYGFVRPDEGVDADKDCDGEIIISGHIHLKQQFGKVIYPGSPFAQNANDVGQIKGVHLFCTDTYQMTFFECPLPQWKALEYTIDTETSIQQMHDSLAENIDDRNFWVLNVTGPKASLSQYFSSKLYKNFAKGKRIKLNTTFTDKHRKLGSIKATSTLQVALDYASNIYKGTIDKEQLQQAIRDVVEQADLK